MRKFILTSAKIEGRILLYYKADKLIKVEIEAELSDEQTFWLFGNVPIFISSIALFKENSKMTILEELATLTFDSFYEEYGYKVGRLKAKTAWDRMSRADQMKAYLWIPAYKSWLKKSNGTATLMPATYLTAKRWED